MLLIRTTKCTISVLPQNPAHPGWLYSEPNAPLGGGCWDDNDGEMMAEVEVVLRCGDDGVGEDDVVRIVVAVASNNSSSDGEMYAVDVVTRRWLLGVYRCCWRQWPKTRQSGAKKVGEGDGG
ncbi:hypothetical protein Tco_1416976 [Tanacetum coccineum]